MGMGFSGCEAVRCKPLVGRSGNPPLSRPQHDQRCVRSPGVTWSRHIGHPALFRARHLFFVFFVCCELVDINYFLATERAGDLQV
jgi:hypothetical protein